MKLFTFSFSVLYNIRTQIYLSAALLLLLQPFNALSQDREHGVHIGLFYPLSTHGSKAPEYSNIFSLHGIAGVSKEEKAFTLSGISSIISGDARGFQVAGISNHIGGFSEGFKAAGIINIYHGARGVQAAGFANIASRDITGMQAAGFFNKVDNLHGSQVAGFLNISHQVHGSQVAGYINVAKDVKGAQVAGYINIADNVDGAQVAGFINIAEKVKGVQVSGLINIADSSEYPIGIINIIKNGEKWIGITTDDNFTTMIAMRSGSKKLYGIVGLGYNFQNTKHVFARQVGLGAHFFTRDNFRLNTEATITSIENFKKGDFDKFSISVVPALKIGSSLELFGGPSFNLVNTNTDDGKKLVDHFIWNNTNHSNHLHGFYVGYTAGLHMKF